MRGRGAVWGETKCSRTGVTSSIVVGSKAPIRRLAFPGGSGEEVPHPGRAILSRYEGLAEMCPHVELPNNLGRFVTRWRHRHVYTLITLKTPDRGLHV